MSEQDEAANDAKAWDAIRRKWMTRAEAERERVLAYLRQQGYTDCAEAIEAGERLKAEERSGVVSDSLPVPDAREERSASDAPVSNWQPIETAPKDGEAVLVTVDGEHGFATYHEWSFTPEELACCRQGTPETFAGWCDDYSGEPMEPQPTHWMPLPSRLSTRARS